MQQKGYLPPQYEVMSEEGPDHLKTFNIVVKTNGRITGTGSGLSKKEAEQKAAAEALENLNEKENE